MTSMPTACVDTLHPDLVIVLGLLEQRLQCPVKILRSLCPPRGSSLDDTAGHDTGYSIDIVAHPMPLQRVMLELTRLSDMIPIILYKHPAWIHVQALTERGDDHGW